MSNVLSDVSKMTSSGLLLIVVVGSNDRTMPQTNKRSTARLKKLLIRLEDTADLQFSWRRDKGSVMKW